MKSTIRTSRPLFAYVGSYTTPERHGQGNGINVYRVDRRTGAFTPRPAPGRAGESVVPRHQCRRHAPLFGAWRSQRGQFLHHRSAAPAISRRSIASRPAATIRSISPSMRPAASSPSCNYGTDSLAVLPVADDGSLLPYRDAHHRHGDAGAAPHPAAHHVRAPHPARSPGPLLLRAVQGLRRRHRLSPRPQARASLVEAARVAARPGAAPRHIDFPSHARRWPMSSTSSIRRSRPTARTARAARSRRCRRFPSTPSDFTGYSTGAEIWVDRAGRNVYVSNRGHDSIGVFAHRSGQGHARAAPVGADARRHAALLRLRSGRSASSMSPTRTAARSSATGSAATALLAPTRIRVKVGSPACIVFSH